MKYTNLPASFLKTVSQLTGSYSLYAEIAIDDTLLNEDGESCALLYTSQGPCYPENPDAPVSSCFTLGQAYPNPFNPVCHQPVSVHDSGLLELQLFDLTGRRVRDLYHGEITAGAHTLTIDASELSSGMYFVRATMEGKTKVNKILLAR